MLSPVACERFPRSRWVAVFGARTGGGLAGSVARSSFTVVASCWRLVHVVARRRL